METNTIDINGLAQSSLLRNESYPQEAGVDRYFTQTEISGILNPARAMIEEPMNTIKSNTEDLKMLNKQSDLIRSKLDDDIQKHQMASNSFDAEIGKLDADISQLQHRIGVLTSDSEPKAKNTKPHEPTKGGNNLGLWLILAGLAVDLITIGATWSTQREAFGIDAITERIWFVMGIFGMSFILHFLHRKTQNKAAMVAICVGLVMSLVVAFHVVWATAVADVVPASTEFSLNLAETAVEPVAEATSGGNLLTMFKEKPGIAEFFFMFACFVTAVISTFVTNSAKGNMALPQIPSTQSQTEKDYVIPILQREMLSLNAKRQAIVFQKEREENEFSQKVSTYKERLEQIVSDVRKKNESIAAAKKAIQSNIESVLKNLSALRMSILTMHAMLEGTLQTNMKYAVASEENVKAYFGIN